MRRALRASRGRPVPGVALHGRLPGSLVLACFLSLGEFVLLIKASGTASQGRSAQKSVSWSCRVRQANSQRSFTRPARGGKVEALLVLEQRAVPERAAQPFNQPDVPQQAGSRRLSQTLGAYETVAHREARPSDIGVRTGRPVS